MPPRSSPRQLVRRLRHSARRAYERLFSSRSEYQRRLSLTLRQWLLHHQKEIGFAQCTWMGLPAYKNPLDAWIYQEILHEVRPEVLVEIGSARAAARSTSRTCSTSSAHGKIVSIDVDRSRFQASHPRIAARDRRQLVAGDRRARAARSRRAERARRPRRRPSQATACLPISKPTRRSSRKGAT